jgi:hypothetical protein
MVKVKARLPASLSIMGDSNGCASLIHGSFPQIPAVL